MALARRIPRQILQHKGRFLSLVFLIALGSMTLTMLNLVVDNLQGNFDWLSDEGRVDDIRVWTVAEPANLDSLGQLLHADIDGRTAVDATWQEDITLRIFEENQQVDRPVILEGHALKRDQEILLNPAFASEHNLAIGEQIVLAGRTFWISGYFSLPDYIYPTQFESDLLADPKNFGIAVVTKRAIQLLAADAPVEDWTVDRSYGIRFHPGFAKSAPEGESESNSQPVYQDLKDRFKDRYGLVRWLERKDNVRINMVKGEISGQQAMSQSLPVAIFLINCVLLASILWRMIRLEFPLIGTLRALGLSRAEVLRHYLALPLTLAVIGSIIGTIGGMTTAQPLLVYYTVFFNLPLSIVRFDPMLILSGTLIPIGLLLLTASYVVLRAVRLPPNTLIRGFRRRPKAMFIEQLFHFHNLRFTTKFRARQMVRSSGKLFGALIGVSFAAMMMLTGFLVQDSYDIFLGEGLRNTFRYDKNYVFKAPQNTDRYGGEPYQMLAGRETGSGDALLVQGLVENSQYLQLIDDAGLAISLPAKSKTCVISRVLADKFDLDTGDTLSFIDDINDEIHYLRIGGIAEIYTLNTVYIPLAEFNRRFERPDDTYIGLYSDRELDIDSEVIAQTEDMSEMIASLESYTMLMRISLLSIGLFSSLMALLILYILFSLLIDENSRSIALLKIMGYEAREIRTLMLRIFDLPFLLGFLAGIPLLFEFYGSMMEQAYEEINMTMPLHLSLQNILSGFVILYLTYLLTRNLSGRKILRIAMSDVLKSMQE